MVQAFELRDGIGTAFMSCLAVSKPHPNCTHKHFVMPTVMQVKKDFQDAVLSYRQDDFFRKNMYANFGDIGAAVKELVDEFQKQTNNSKRINTIEDMQV